jgi:type I restriction enzyme, S subunit
MDKTTLKNVTTKIGSGATPAGGRNSYHVEGIALVRSQNVLDLRFSNDGLAFISEEQASKLDNVIVEEDDVLLNITGDSIARACLVPKAILPARVNQHVSIIRTSKEIDSRYILYYLQYLKPYLLKICKVGGTRNALTKEAIEKLEIEIRDNHAGIAAVLSALDTKIELNQRINAQLESMAKTLYDYWFVQFDFPNENGDPYKSCGGKIVWNEELKRKIPIGWEKGILSDLGTISGGSTPPRGIDDYFNVNGTAWITPKDLSLNTGNKFITKGETGVSDKGLKAASLTIMPKGTILLSTRAPIGYMAIAREMVTTNQGFKSFIPDKGYSIPYIYYTVKNAIPTIVNHASGSTFKEASGSVLKGISICLPPVPITEKFGKTVGAIFERQNKLELESQTLTELRDWLLPMLMNGQVKVC